MKRYPIRVVKYIVYLSVVLALVFALMQLIGNNNLTWQNVFGTQRGLLMLGVVVVFALAHPFLGYTRKTLIFDATKRTDDIDRVMGMCGYIKVDQTPEVMTYRASTVSKKLLLIYEDTITITTVDETSVIEGPRKEVVKIYFRMGTFIG